VLYGHPDWSPMRLLQAIKRAHRQGQTRTVTVIKLLAENSIEENLQSKWYSKQQDFDQAIDGGVIQRDTVWKSLSTSDIVHMI
jgi:SNF2 family DNA or RNA helicase